jgi:Zn ribbon nucleic-acid-binding protein
MALCSQCKFRFATLEDEEGMHECPRCGYTGRKPEEDVDEPVRAALIRAENFLDDLATITDATVDEGDPAIFGSFRDGAAVQRDRLAGVLALHDELLAALKAMVASYDGIRDGLTSRTVIAKLQAADAAIAKAESLDAR